VEIVEPFILTPISDTAATTRTCSNTTSPSDPLKPNERNELVKSILKLGQTITNGKIKQILHN
jgi:hypothetical protein